MVLLNPCLKFKKYFGQKTCFEGMETFRGQLIFLDTFFQIFIDTFQMNFRGYVWGEL